MRASTGLAASSHVDKCIENLRCSIPSSGVSTNYMIIIELLGNIYIYNALPVLAPGTSVSLQLDE
jgi:hypothetical protein